MSQNRYRSPVAWGTVVAILLFIGKNYGLFGFVGLTADSFKELTDLIFVALLAFGVFNNPEAKTRF